MFHQFCQFHRHRPKSCTNLATSTKVPLFNLCFLISLVHVKCIGHIWVFITKLVFRLCVSTKKCVIVFPQLNTFRNIFFNKCLCIQFTQLNEMIYGALLFGMSCLCLSANCKVFPSLIRLYSWRYLLCIILWWNTCCRHRNFQTYDLHLVIQWHLLKLTGFFKICFLLLCF